MVCKLCSRIICFLNNEYSESNGTKGMKADDCGQYNRHTDICHKRKFNLTVSYANLHKRIKHITLLHR